MPHCQIQSIRSLEAGSSFNNRLYFLKIQVPTSCKIRGLSNSDGTNLVLKLSGRFWGPAKVQNEVSSMLLLKSATPEIPVPEVVAWSHDGRYVVSMVQNEAYHAESCTTSLPIEAYSSTHTGWILMTMLPGKPLADHDLESHAYVRIAQELADYVAAWRQAIPVSPHCGNIKYSLPALRSALQVPDSKHIDQMRLWDRLYDVGASLVNLGTDLATPIVSLREYILLKLRSRLNVLNQNDVFIPNRRLLGAIQRAISSVSNLLSALGPGHQQDRFVFTHTDLAPRNILVSGDPPRITGILDFEFSGFFPLVEEYQNDWGKDDGDWAQFAYQAFLERLEDKGIATPLRGDMKRLWAQLDVCFTLETYIAPWWLEQGGVDNVTQELEQASRRVLEAIDEVDKYC